MRRDVHLDVGTRVIRPATGDLGEVVEPFYMARPDIHEIAVHWDAWGDSERSECIDRAEIEYEGSAEYASAFRRWGHDKERAGG